MSPEKKYTFQSSFAFNGKVETISFLKATEIVEGVICRVFKFDNDSNKDLGIIEIEEGRKTPLQKVLKGKKTIEGYLFGKGKLTITRKDGTNNIYNVDEHTRQFSIEVGKGETVQWQAAPDSNLSVFEICFPPYEDGRFENLQE